MNICIGPNAICMSRVFLRFCLFACFCFVLLFFLLLFVCLFVFVFVCLFFLFSLLSDEFSVNDNESLNYYFPGVA